jgi:type II secretory pathway pseudopilin PulG
MVELLTVIAIIAILAAITFPVYARAKDSAFRSSDISNMNDLRNALQLYREDQGSYPPALLGYATLYMTGPNAGNVVPANSVAGKLFPRRIPNIDTLRPAYLRQPFDGITTAVWPEADPRPVGSSPILDLNGDGNIDSSDDLAGARQLYGPSTTVVRPAPVPTNPAENILNESGNSWTAHFYRVSGYDVSLVRTSSGERYELRYALFWSDFGLGGGDAQDDPRQLGYSEPPETTVVTWNSFFREVRDGQIQRNKRDVVLFLGGGAKSYDSLDVSQRSWRVLP